MARRRSEDETQSERAPPPTRSKSGGPRRATTHGRRAAAEKARTDTAPEGLRRAQKRTAPPPTERTLYAGRYELEGLLGVGAMGSVYRARDVLLGEVVALKVLRKDLAHAPLAVSRFHREAKLARRLTHPNITRVYDVAEYGGEHYMTMECVEGESLHALLDAGEPLGASRAVSVALQIARALGAAHEKGVVHCDLKPENVVVESTGRAVLTDFGVSKSERDASPPPLPGHAAGTPLYMAPEQLEGRRVEARTDLYALGLLLYEMLTGKTPWGRRGGIAASVARVAVPPKSPREHDARISEELAALVMKLLEREPTARPASAREVEATLDGIARASGDRPSTPRVLHDSASPPAARAPAPIATTATPNTRGIAVLPLRNLGDEKTHYVTDALTTELADRLALAPGLRVASRAAIEEGERPDEDLRALGRRLGVEAIVEGSLLVRAGGQMRVSVRLVEVERGFVLWSARLDRSSRELYQVADEVIAGVARSLGIEVKASPSSGNRGPSSGDAVDPFLRALAAFDAYSAEGAREAERLLADAFLGAPKDPILASWLALAKLQRWAFEPSLGQGDEAAPVVAERIAQGVLKKNASVGEAHLALATLADLQGHPAEAMRRAREAVRCTPTLAEAHRLAGQLQAEASTTFEGERDLDVSLRLDPKSVRTLLSLVRTRALKRDFERALEWLAVAEQRAPGHMGVLLSRIQLALWREDAPAVLRERARVSALPRDHGEPLAHAVRVLARVNEDVEMGKLAAVAAAPGTTARRRASIMQLICEERARVADREGALSALRSADACGTVDVLWVDRCPALAPLRSLPGFLSLRASILARAADVLAAGTGARRP